MLAPIPLLSPFRRRSIGSARLCALLVVLKVAIAAGCLATDAPASLAPLAAQAGQVDGTLLAVASDQDIADAGCWHADIGDCHGSCMHAMPLAGDADVRAAARPLAPIFVTRLPALNAPSKQNKLRPLIA
jgi:hypothetical protein